MGRCAEGALRALAVEEGKDNRCERSRIEQPESCRPGWLAQPGLFDDAQ
jgi:hypothetical protein